MELTRREWLAGGFLRRPCGAAPAAAAGTAVLLSWSCLAVQGTFCSVCVEHCPVPGALRLDSGRPVVAAEACTGCGRCAYACPAPGGAIIVAPRGVADAAGRRP